MTDRERLLDELRPVSFAIAYRMLGSVSETEDVVQEALLRVNQAMEAGEQIASPRAFVATVTTRLAINELHSARARRERYVGDWLPEPIVTGGHDDPAQHAEMAESLSLSMLVLLESLSPEQRAVLLLHDVFDYDYPQVAEIIGKSQDNVRQLATRARRHVGQRRPRFQTTREQRQELAAQFFQAVEQGDLSGLEALLAHDVEFTGDGGGKAPALARALRGRDRVARTLVDYSVREAAFFSRMQIRATEINGSPGVLSRRTAAADRRRRARDQRRSDHKRQLDRQPGQADPPWASRRHCIATELSDMTPALLPRRAAVPPARFPSHPDVTSCRGETSVNSPANKQQGDHQAPPRRQQLRRSAAHLKDDRRGVRAGRAGQHTIVD